jgi:hypothetical protein
MNTVNKVVLLKTAWCDWYDGDDVIGNFQFVKDHGSKSGHERFNFKKSQNGKYYGYCPPIGQGGTPNPKVRDGWTVIWVAKKPKTKGIRIVGAYYNANFEESNLLHKVDDEEMYYCVSSRDGFVVPPELRNRSFKSPIGSGACCYLIGGNNDKKYKSLSRQLLNELTKLQNLSDSERESISTHYKFPSNAHIRAVEKASVDFVWKHFEAKKYVIKDCQKDKIGYDLEAMNKSNTLLLEVKGTSGDTPYAYITTNELATARGSRGGNWRLCMVTNALTSPTMNIMNTKEFLASFVLEPMTFRAVKKS